MKKILIAYDGSASADAALEDLRRAGLPDELDATVLSVAEVWLPSDARPVVAGNAPVVGEGGNGAAFAVPKLSAEPVADSR